MSRRFANCSHRRIGLFSSVIVIGLVLPGVVFVSLFEEGTLVLRSSIRSGVDVAKPQHTNKSVVVIPLVSENVLSAPTFTPTTSHHEEYVDDSSTSLPPTTPPPITQWMDDEPSKSESISESIQPAVNKDSMNHSDSTLFIESNRQPPSNWPSKRPFEPPVQIQTTPPRIHRNITLIVQLRGELGNQISVLVNARITQLIAETKYPHIHIQLIGQHQYDPKWTKGRDDLVKCFSNAFQNFEFNGGSHDKSGEFQMVQKLQQSWLNGEQLKKLNNVRSFDFLDSLLLQQEQNTPGIPIVPSSSVSKYSLPYLTAISFSWADVIRNEWLYSEIRQWLAFNTEACCNPNISSHDNDIVFHYRNFAQEFRNGKVLQPQFVEISPYSIANVAFQNYTRRDQIRVGITGRFETGANRYIQAFTERGISSYFVTGQKSGTEGLCYIFQTKRETFGLYYSTYYRWAVLLGNATLNRLYQIDTSPDTVMTTATTSVVNGTTTSSILAINTFTIGNRNFTIEKYRQLLQ